MFLTFERSIIWLNYETKFLFLSLKMVEKTIDFVRALEMYHFLKSSRKVTKNLAQEGILVCRRTVNKIINAEEKKNRKTFSSKKQQKPWKASCTYKDHRERSKIAKIIDCADISHQRNLARKYGVSQTTVARIIRVDLGMKYKKKQKTHKLTDKQAAQRFAWDQHSEDGWAEGSCHILWNWMKCIYLFMFLLIMILIYI